MPHPSVLEPYNVLARLLWLSLENDSDESQEIGPDVHVLGPSDEISPTISEISIEFIHDRWPLFTIKTVEERESDIEESLCDVKVKYFAFGGIIYQTYEFNYKGTNNRPPKLVMGADLLIRQLDFIDSENKFNEAPPQDLAYKTELPVKTCVKRSHQIGTGEVALFLIAYCRSKLLTFHQDEEKEAEKQIEEDHDDRGDTFRIAWSDEAVEHFQTNNSLKVTFAYQLEFFPGKTKVFTVLSTPRRLSLQPSRWTTYPSMSTASPASRISTESFGEIWSLFSRSAIVELSDEWLYNMPDFFTKASSDSRNSSAGPSDDESSTSSSTSSEHDRHIVVIDVPWTKDNKKNSLSLDGLMTIFRASSELKSLMQQDRLPSEAKKRFCALFSPSPEANKAYHQTHSEKTAMKSFCKRHVSYDRFFSELTAAELNKWATELHLSFYAVDRRKPRSIAGMAQKDWFNFESFSGDGSPVGLTRIVTSFRFDGDFFDRYWTCHFLECDPHMKRDFSVRREVKALLLPKDHEGADEKKTPWRQRRVLGLILFDRIMRRMQEFMDDILENARHNALREPGEGNSKAKASFRNSSGGVDYNTFRTTSRRCQKYQQILQTY
ncbi:hypothetical protein QQZ08_001137 [Neonectria magnoliae]|uniref:Uncharacterized protein n=1 Tax=Neonectria magnoliae TaxID=2732573 RepID=A0ABR1IEW4_9HYPO